MPRQIRCFLCKRPIALGEQGHAFYIDPITRLSCHYHAECRELMDDIEKDILYA